MAYISTPDPGSASGDLADMFAADTEHRGYLPNYTRVFGHRPALYGAWKQLVGEVARNLGVRSYELATLAAAREMRSSYCSLAHGKVLAEKVFDADTVIELGAGGESELVTAAERELMRFAAAVATDATGITRADIDRLRDEGYDDRDIFDIASAAAARAFFSKMLDALGAEPDEAFWDLDPGLRESLTVGREIEPRSVNGPGSPR